VNQLLLACSWLLLLILLTCNVNNITLLPLLLLLLLLLSPLLLKVLPIICQIMQHHLLRERQRWPAAASTPAVCSCNTCGLSTLSSCSSSTSV
jgi:hypothetical protein